MYKETIQFHKKILLPFLVIISILSSQLLFADNNDSIKTLQEMSIYELMNIKVTTVTRTNITAREAPAAVYIVTERQIRERGYRTLSDALHDIPGFDFQHTYGIFPELIHQRGLVGNNQRTLLYIDGIPDNNISENAILGGSVRFPLQNVKRIEIVSGPASALYGANAFNGVINIITQDGKDDPGTEVSLFGGTWMNSKYTGKGGSFSTRGNLSENGNTISYSISGYYSRSDGPDFRGVRNLNADGKGYWWSDYFNVADSENANITAKFTINNLRLEIVNWQYLQGDGTYANGNYFIDTRDEGFKGTNWDFRNNAISLGYLWKFWDNFSLDSEIISRHTQLLSSSFEEIPNTYFTPEAYDHPDDTKIQENYSRPDAAYEIEERLQWNPEKNINITFGLEAIHTIVPQGYGSYERYKYNNYGLYSQLIYNPIDILSLSGGYRFDHNTIYGNSHTPRAGAVLTPGDFTIKTLFSTGFRAPTAWELFNATSARKENPDLELERMISGELGLGYRFIKRYYFSVQGYYNEISNLMLEVETNDPNATFPGTNWNQNQNVGKAIIRGIEFQSDMQINKNLNLYINYTYSYGKYKDIPDSITSSPAIEGGSEIPTIAPHKINAGINYYLLNTLSIHMRTNYIHERKTISTNPTNTIDGYILLHSNIRWEDAFIKGISIQLMGRNLLDEKAFDPGIRTATGEKYPTQHPIEGRNIWLSLEYEL